MVVRKLWKINENYDYYNSLEVATCDTHRQIIKNRTLDIRRRVRIGWQIWDATNYSATSSNYSARYTASEMKYMAMCA